MTGLPTDDAAPSSPPAARLPYSGLKVLDLSHVIAGPLCTRLLADLGATVIKVESSTGDLMRHLPVPVAPTVSSAFSQYGCGKQSIVVDLKHPDGVAIIKDLVRWADVAVENFSPGALDRLGLGYDVMAAINPAIVLCSISTFGATGPYANQAGFGALAEATSGLMSLTGVDGGPPTHFGTPLADMNAGVHALAAIGAALHQRHETGHGTHIDLASLDALICMIDQAVTLEQFTDGATRFGRYANRHPTTVPSGVVQAGDRRYAVYVAVGDAQFAVLATAMGQSELADDERFAHTPERVANLHALYDLIDAWAATVDSVDTLVETLRRHQLTAGRVMTIEEMTNDPHVIARGTLAEVDVPGVGTKRFQTAPYRFSGVAARPAGPPPRLGEHTDQILTALGLEPEAIGRLRANGVVGADVAGAALPHQSPPSKESP